MLRSFLILFLCAIVFTACSSDDSDALSGWFEDHDIASTYRLQPEEISLSVKKSSIGADASAYLVSSYAALGNANGVEQLLYFDLKISGAPPSTWKLRTDSVFYKDIYKGKFPSEQKTINAEFCWLIEKENEIQHDSLWLKFTNASSMKCEPINTFYWKEGSESRDTFYVSLPNLGIEPISPTDTLRLLAGIKLLDNIVLRIAKPSVADIPGLLRVAQKTIISNECEKCLHAGVRESLFVSFSIKAEDKIKIAGKPVVFAELVLPRQGGTSGNELEHPVIVNLYNDGLLEDYRVDILRVNIYFH
jgi:hypothetical protein